MRGAKESKRRGRGSLRPLAFTLVVGVVVVGALSLLLAAPDAATDGQRAASSAAATPSPTPRPPEITFSPPAGAKQAARFLQLRFSASEPLEAVSVRLAPDPGFACAAALEDATTGRVSCSGLLPASTDHLLTLSVEGPLGSGERTYAFRTMGDRLENVQWFTEFENPSGNPVACAAASCRIVQLFTTGEDKMTAEQILEFGRQFNRSQDPGLDPVAIAELLQRMDARNTYHYYVFATREEATKASVYWLLRTGKPVIAITLAGQHAPLVIGYTGRFGASYADPATRIEGLIVMDPQRGDLDPRNAHRRPDKKRSAAFQTGALIGMDEWNRDEWWFGFPYQAVIQYGGRNINVERNDGAYPLPHWGGKFVILVDDGDRENPADRMGRVSP